MVPSTKGGQIRSAKLGYVFAELEECNLTFVREFYANWDTSFGESTKVKIRGQVVNFIARAFNAFLERSVVDPSMYFILLEKPPYRDIFHTLYGEHSSACWGGITMALTLHFCSPTLLMRRKFG